MSNFAFLKKDERFSFFAGAAEAAEKTYAIDPGACIFNCRRALESALRWVYTVDDDLEMPYNDSLKCMLDGKAFREMVGDTLFKQLDYIRRAGNEAGHTDQTFTGDEAMLCLENLHAFLDYIAFCYSDPEDYQQKDFDPGKVTAQTSFSLQDVPEEEMDLHALMEENQALRKLLTSRRLEKRPAYTPRKLNLNEYKTRKLYIDSMLRDARWQEGVNWKNDVVVQGMPNQQAFGCVDYVLYGTDGKPLALIEARRTGAEAALGRQQARLYADLMEKQWGTRPYVYVSNGVKTLFSMSPEDVEREVEAFHSPQDLERMRQIEAEKRALKRVSVRKKIADRYYQREAVQAVCRALDQEKRRSAVVSMAAGTGKTRTLIALCEVLRYHRWVRRVLYLAASESLVKQTTRAFQWYYPEFPAVNLCEGVQQAACSCVLSTYQRMAESIDCVQDEKGCVFTSGYFDLIILDEMEDARSKNHRDLLAYFDGRTVIFTAAPAYEKNPAAPEAVYTYAMERAVQDGFLVPYILQPCRLRHLSEGIRYDQLSADEQESYRQIFAGDGKAPPAVSARFVQEKMINRDTIREALQLLMTQGIRTGNQGEIGKSILFARDLEQAEVIRQVFYQLYPHLGGYAEVLDESIPYAQTLLDAFSAPHQPPYLAIASGMLDMGVDIPQVVNLMFFRRVCSKSRFYQMLGRGIRPCEGLLDGKDKTCCRVFDLLDHAALFQTDELSRAEQLTPEGQRMALWAEGAFLLQGMPEKTAAIREKWVQAATACVQGLDRNAWQVKMHLDRVDVYSLPESYRILTRESVQEIRRVIASLMGVGNEPESMVRFDVQMYAWMLALLKGGEKGNCQMALDAYGKALRGISHLPEAQACRQEIEMLCSMQKTAPEDVAAWEQVRCKLRALVPLLPPVHTVMTDFDDHVLYEK